MTHFFVVVLWYTFWRNKQTNKCVFVIAAYIILIIKTIPNLPAPCRTSRKLNEIHKTYLFSLS